jgi:hypothetical protein
MGNPRASEVAINERTAPWGCGVVWMRFYNRHSARGVNADRKAQRVLAPAAIPGWRVAAPPSSASSAPGCTTSPRLRCKRRSRLGFPGFFREASPPAVGCTRIKLPVIGWRAPASREGGCWFVSRIIETSDVQPMAQPEAAVDVDLGVSALSTGEGNKAHERLQRFA